MHLKYITRHENQVREAEDNHEDDEGFSSQEIICDARTRRALGNKELACDHCDYKTRSATLLKRHNDSMHTENTIAVVIRNMREWLECGN